MLDLAVVSEDGFLDVLSNRGKGTFVSAGSQSILGLPTSLVAADFDRDGHTDSNPNLYRDPRPEPVDD